MKRRKTVIAAFELLIIIVCLFLVSYAWFTDNKELKDDDLLMKTNAHFDLLLSTDNGDTWTTHTSLNIPSDFMFKNEITGNGVDFYIPATKRDDGTPITFARTDSSDYLEFDILFKINTTAGIFLQDSSYVVPAVGSRQENLIGTGVERISSSGNFSRDLIASSVRIAFIDNNIVNEEYIPDSTASLVWAPNKKYKIDCDTSCSVDLNSNEEQSYFYVDGSTTGTIAKRPVKNIIDDNLASFENQDGNGSHYLTFVNSGINNGIRKVTVRIWIEGNDRDNVTALTGGMFKMNLEFTALSKVQNNSLPSVSAVGSSIDGINSDMEYSTNYGITYQSYNEENPVTFNTGDTVYVRYSETPLDFASDYVVVNF